MNPWLLGVYRQEIGPHLELALTAGWGLELQAFSHPAVLEQPRTLLKAYRSLLAGFSGPLALHGAFFDMSVHSEDARIIATTRTRYLQNLDVAVALGAQRVIFHTNFLPMLRHPRFREQWLTRNLAFWSDFAGEARQRGLHIALENMWDPDPYLLQALMNELQSPDIGVCLDVSHTRVYGSAYPLETWLAALAPYIIHIHLNNTDGSDDNHLGLQDARGVLHYASVLPYILSHVSDTVWMVLELDDPDLAAQGQHFILGERAFCKA